MVNSLMQQNILTDITIWRWQFYFRSYGYDPNETATKCWELFKPLLDRSVQWAGGWGRSKTQHEGAIPDSSGSFRLASIDWIRSGKEARSLEARAMLDVFFIHTGVAQLGESPLGESITLLRNAETRADKNKETFLGEAVCVWCEVSRERESEIPDLAKELLNAWFGREIKCFELLEFVFGFAVLPSGEGEEFWGLLVWNDQVACTQANKLNHRIFPQFFMSNLKARALLQTIKHKDLTLVTHQTENKLDQLIKGTLTQKHSLSILERGISDLTQYRLVLSERINELSNYIATLEINVGNITRLMNSTTLSKQRDQLDVLFSMPLELELENAKNSFRYLQSSLSRSEQIAHGLESKAQILSAQWGRILSVLLGLFVVLGIPGVFPGITNIYWLWRLLILIGMAFVLWLLLYILSRRY